MRALRAFIRFGVAGCFWLAAIIGRLEFGGTLQFESGERRRDAGNQLGD